MNKEEVKKGRKSEEKGLDAKKHAPFYDMLKEISYKNEKIPKNDEQTIKNLIIGIVNLMSIEIGKVGFWNNPKKQKDLRAAIDDKILYSGISKLVENKEQVVLDFMKLAKNRTKEILL
jgi:hypothetical protein